ncbi:uncharacterized protein FSUBG_10444 [Fusarium subglutinans]|uniref:Uncharacterized protein n=1 Tax=Gibberella subglutinans TaxID=42677 RepID=A0A8H5P7M1_GIBSU|nr:uncharacterized protein FSUBG_10444 [Fusarium subglutinans]KAF5591518.1 hypothetical protein FSUBG_10444 [Fusarium subglutinans]
MAAASKKVSRHIPNIHQSHRRSDRHSEKSHNIFCKDKFYTTSTVRHYPNTVIIMNPFLNMLDDLQIGVQALTKDLKSRDLDQVTELVDLLMKDMKSIASALKDTNTEELNDPNLLREHQKLLQLTEFDAKLAYSEMDRDEAFKYPWMTTNNCEDRFKTLELSIQHFADHAVDAGPSMRTCTPPFTKLVVMLRGIVMEYLKFRHRRIVMQLDQAVEIKTEEGLDTQDLDKDEVLSYKEQWTDALVPEWESGAIQVITIEPKNLLNSSWKANQLYDEESGRSNHPLLQWCKLDLMDREEGVLHWSLGGVVAWRFYGENEWMDRSGHVIDETEY